MKRVVLYIFYLHTAIMLSSCVEEVNLTTEAEFESALVVEGTITNELKQQQIFLSRTYKLEEDGPNPESSAIVTVIGSTGESYLFQETELGRYVSNSSFAAQPNVEYTLEIITSNGRSYTSSSIQLTPLTTIENLYVDRDFNENDVEGVSVYVDTYDPTGNSKYYRYEYEETYKIIAPAWVSQDVSYEVVDGVLEFPLSPRPIEELVCYNTKVSNNINIASTQLFTEDRLEKYRVRFLNRDNYIISHRYSILVKQFIQSQEAHSFYRALAELSENENILSETQPGFLQGNMRSITDTAEKVIGFFEVSSVAIERLYFNYEDLFPGEPLPPYIQNCAQTLAPPIDNGGGICKLCSAIDEGYKYFGPNEPEDPEEEGPIDLVSRACGDCTVLGVSEPPDFWID